MHDLCANLAISRMLCPPPVHPHPPCHSALYSLQGQLKRARLSDEGERGALETRLLEHMFPDLKAADDEGAKDDAAAEQATLPTVIQTFQLLQHGLSGIARIL